MVLKHSNGRELPIRLAGIALPEERNCRAYMSDVVEKAFNSPTAGQNPHVPKQPVNLNMGCADSVMKKRAELAAIWLSQFVGQRVKLEFTQRYSEHGENVGRVTLLDTFWMYPEEDWSYKNMKAPNPSITVQNYYPNFNYQGVSLAEELVRLGYVTRIFQAVL